MSGLAVRRQAPNVHQPRVPWRRSAYARKSHICADFGELRARDERALHITGGESRLLDALPTLRSTLVGFSVPMHDLARERLSVTSAGQVRLQLRQPWADGTTHLVFDPVEFLGRLAVLVPRPRINLVLYHGVLGPRAAWRAAVVPREAMPTGGGSPAPETRPVRVDPERWTRPRRMRIGSVHAAGFGRI